MTRKMTQAEYARHAGVSKMAVHNWIKRGRIEIGEDGLIDPEAADRMRAATESPLPHHQARKAQWEEQKRAAREQQSASAEMPPLEKIGAAYRLETYKLQKAKAEAANIELDRLAGALIERSEVDHVLADLASTLRTMLENVPDRLAPLLGACKTVHAAHKLLEDAMHDILTEISDTMQRKAKDM